MNLGTRLQAGGAHTSTEIVIERLSDDGSLPQNRPTAAVYLHLSFVTCFSPARLEGSRYALETFSLRRSRSSASPAHCGTSPALAAEEPGATNECGAAIESSGQRRLAIDVSRLVSLTGGTSATREGGSRGDRHRC